MTPDSTWAQWLTFSGIRLGPQDRGGLGQLFLKHHQADANQPAAAEKAVGFSIKDDRVDALGLQRQPGEVRLNPRTEARELDQAHAAVPPTVSPSMSKVG